MTCDELIAKLAESVGGELVVEHHETVTVHIQGCPKCEVYVASYTHTMRFGRTLPKCGQLPAAFEARLREVLAEHLGGE